MTTAIGDETTGDDVIDEPATDVGDVASSSAATPDGPAGDGADEDTPPPDEPAITRRKADGPRWVRVLAYGLLPGLALVLAAGAGYLKWQSDSARQTLAAQTQSVAAATESTIALLSYQSDTADQQLSAARDRLTGTFGDSYSALIHDVVIPGAQQKHISAVATVPAAASISASANRAEVLVFVDQSITVGTDAPTSSASSVKITLDKIGQQWLISEFTPV